MSGSPFNHAGAAESAPGRLNGFPPPGAKPDLNEVLLALITANPCETFVVRTRAMRTRVMRIWVGWTRMLEYLNMRIGPGPRRAIWQELAGSVVVH